MLGAHTSVLVCPCRPHSRLLPASSRTGHGAAPSRRCLPCLPGPRLCPSAGRGTHPGLLRASGAQLDPTFSLEASASPRSDKASHAVCGEDPEQLTGVRLSLALCAGGPSHRPQMRAVPLYTHGKNPLSLCSFSIRGKSPPKRHFLF